MNQLNNRLVNIFIIYKYIIHKVTIKLFIKNVCIIILIFIKINIFLKNHLFVQNIHKFIVV